MSFSSWVGTGLRQRDNNDNNDNANNSHTNDKQILVIVVTVIISIIIMIHTNTNSNSDSHDKGDKSFSSCVGTGLRQPGAILSYHGNVFEAYACLKHSNFLEVKVMNR